MSTAQPIDIAEWVRSCVLTATDGGRYLVLCYAFGGGAKEISLLTTGRRFFGEISRLFIEEYPDHHLQLGRPSDPKQLEYFVSLHRGLRLQKFTSDHSLSGDARRVVRDVIADIAPSHWYARGFLLVDICDFSTRTPGDQLALRLLLDASVRKAKTNLVANWKLAAEEADLSLIPTGDGYYIWHRRASRHADSITFALGALLLGELKRHRWRDIDLRLRIAMAIGEAYTFPYRDLSADLHLPATHRDAIGPVLNTAARLCSGAAPGQLLISDFSSLRLNETDQIRSAAALVQAATAIVGAGDFTLKITPEHRLKVVDKHGEGHHCYNVCGDVFYYTGPTRRSTRIGVIPDQTPRLEPNEFSEYK